MLRVVHPAVHAYQGVCPAAALGQISPLELKFGGQLNTFLPTLTISIHLLVFSPGISKSDSFYQQLWRQRLQFLNLPRGKETLCVFNLNFVFMTF